MRTIQFFRKKNRSEKKKLKKHSHHSKSPQLEDNSVRTIETLKFVTKHPQQDKIEQKSKKPDISKKTPIQERIQTHTDRGQGRDKTNPKMM